jgi:hypothetical protein
VYHHEEDGVDGDELLVFKTHCLELLFSLWFMLVGQLLVKKDDVAYDVVDD